MCFWDTDIFDRFGSIMCIFGTSGGGMANGHHGLYGWVLFGVWVLSVCHTGPQWMTQHGRLFRLHFFLFSFIWREIWQFFVDALKLIFCFIIFFMIYFFLAKMRLFELVVLPTSIMLSKLQGFTINICHWRLLKIWAFVLFTFFFLLLVNKYPTIWHAYYRIVPIPHSSYWYVFCIYEKTILRYFFLNRWFSGNLPLFKY